MTEPAGSPASRAVSAADVVTIPRSEYDLLLATLEDLEDRLALAEAEGSERIPHAVAKQLMLGPDHPLKVWRQYRNLTQQQLSVITEIPQNTISNIETGRSPGTVPVLKALANALDVTVDDLL